MMENFLIEMRLDGFFAYNPFTRFNALMVPLGFGASKWTPLIDPVQAGKKVISDGRRRFRKRVKRK